MIVKQYHEIESQPIQMEGVSNTSIRWLIGEKSRAPNFYMRLFELEAGGHTPYHTHAWEHEVFVVEGNGRINTADGSLPLSAGTFALVLPQEEHQFENTGDEALKFLCIIPRDGK